MGIIYPADSQLALASFSRDRFSAATELGAVNWAQLIGAKSHGFLQFGFKGSVGVSISRDSLERKPELRSTIKENSALAAGAMRRK
jgi:hypothetical protein